jgi:DNA-binding NtrC family response regulator
MNKVLVIEHDGDTRSTLTELLAADGYAPVAVSGTEEAREYLTGDEPPCMVLLDLAERDDAVAFLQWLRDHEHLRDVQVAVMSGWHRAERRLADFRENISRVMKKPFDMGELMGVVAQHCGPTTRN